MFARAVSKLGALLSVMAVSLAMGGSAASAGMVIDLRLTGVTGPAFTQVGPKKVQYNYTGTGSIQYEAWAVITGADGVAALEGLMVWNGSFVSTNIDNGVVLGNTSVSVAPIFRGVGWLGGTTQDLDGDGDLDVGGAAHNNAAGWIYGSSAIGTAVQVTSANASNVPPDAFQALPNGGLAVKLADVTFTLTGETAGPSLGTSVTALDWRGREKATATQHPYTWQEDGTQTRLTVIGSTVGSTGPIEIVPEPASIALVTLLGAVALVWFRRR